MIIEISIQKIQTRIIINPQANKEITHPSIKMQMRQKLITQPISTPSSNQYFIDRYNKVIDIYNTSSHSQTNIKLKQLDNSQLFKKIYSIFSKSIVKILLVIMLAFVPGINVIVLGILFFYYLFLRRQGKIHKRNIKLIVNPLEGYYFLPEVCQQLGKHCTTLQIKTKDIQGFTFNTNLYQQLKTKSKVQDVIVVTIYDQYFYDSFHLIKKQQYKITAWIILAIVLIAVDVVFYMALFDLY